MSDLSVRAKTLEDEATPGPWSQGMCGERLLNEVDNQAAFGFITVTPNLSDDGVDGVADATFIAESRELVPALAAEVERLEAEVEKLNYEVMAHQVGDGYEKGHEHGSLVAVRYRDERDELVGRNEQLQAELAKNDDITLRQGRRLEQLVAALRLCIEANHKVSTKAPNAAMACAHLKTFADAADLLASLENFPQ